MASSLVSVPTLVESPFIIAKIGNYTFGSATKSGSLNRFGGSVQVTFPNYMTGLEITKVNGGLNSYVLSFTYAITPGNDPNLLDKIFSSVSDKREIILSYGDWNSPNYIYKEEKALITNVKSQVDFSQSRINYTVSAVSNMVSITAATYDFGAREAKPSGVLLGLLRNASYGLSQIFPGMRNIQQVIRRNLIATTDAVVKLEAKMQTNILEYINYLVNSMQPEKDKGNGLLKSSKYYLTINDNAGLTHDGGGGVFGGSSTNTTATGNMYGGQGASFQITEVPADGSGATDFNTYEVDVGYPTDNFITNFSLVNDESWTILYDASMESPQDKYIYRINNEGHLISEFSPSFARDTQLMKTTVADQSWWTEVTQFPISATLTIKGLTRPSMLMQNVKVNAYFYGQKHNSSGLYVVTNQQDSINSQGYKTTLSLLRIKGD